MIQLERVKGAGWAVGAQKVLSPFWGHATSVIQSTPSSALTSNHHPLPEGPGGLLELA